MNNNPTATARALRGRVSLRLLLQTMALIAAAAALVVPAVEPAYAQTVSNHGSAMNTKLTHGDTETLAPDAPECALTGRVCLWNDANFQGKYSAYATQVLELPPASQDQVSSIWNRYSQAWVFYRDKGFVHPLFCVLPGRRVHDLRDYGFNDQITSLRRTGSTSCPSGIPVLSD